MEQDEFFVSILMACSYTLILNSLAFGDSYTYVQGTAGRQNYSFIGDLQNYAFNASTLLTDEIVQNQVVLRSAINMI
jgi:hypothetical protein